MKKTTGIFILLLCVLMAGFFWSYTKKHKNTTQTEVEQVTIEGVAPAQKTESVSGMGTLAELRSQNKDLECQIIFERENDDPIEGTYFTSKGTIRGDFLVPSEGTTEKLLPSMIVGGDALYVWSAIEGESFGFKSSLSTQSDVKTKEPVPIDTPIKYTCSVWKAVDGSIFVPPTNVSFKDVSTVLEEGMEDGTILP